MTFISFMTKIQIPNEQDKIIDHFSPLKDTSNLLPRRILKFNIKADPNLYGNVPTEFREDVVGTHGLFLRFDFIQIMDWPDNNPKENKCLKI